jgi:hypothetical protein
MLILGVLGARGVRIESARSQNQNTRRAIEPASMLAQQHVTQRAETKRKRHHRSLQSERGRDLAPDRWQVCPRGTRVHPLDPRLLADEVWMKRNQPPWEEAGAPNTPHRPPVACRSIQAL